MTDAKEAMTLANLSATDKLQTAVKTCASKFTFTIFILKMSRHRKLILGWGNANDNANSLIMHYFFYQ